MNSLYYFTPFHQVRKYMAGGRSQFYAYSADNERVMVYDSARQETSVVQRDLDAKVLRNLRLGASDLQ